MGDGRTDRPVTGADLYGGSGRPVGSDIVQGGLGDCYLVSTLEQYAERQPGVITDSIRYDAKHQRFGVTLHDAAGRTKTMTVTQADLRADRTYGAGGGVDGPAYWPRAHADGSRPPAWPIVMEVAYAKLNAGSTHGTAAELGRIANGGWPRDAVHALTGRADTRVVSAAGLSDPAEAYVLLETSIRENRAVLLATNPMKDKPTTDWSRVSITGQTTHGTPATVMRSRRSTRTRSATSRSRCATHGETTSSRFRGSIAPTRLCVSTSRRS